MTVRVHLFPSRTQQLSSLVPTILGWKRPGKIGRRQHKRKTWTFVQVFLLFTGLPQISLAGRPDRQGIFDRLRRRRTSSRLPTGPQTIVWGVFLCVGLCVSYRFLRTANLITALNYGRMARRCHSQAAANENGGLYPLCAAASGLVRWVVQPSSRAVGDAHPYTLRFLLCVGSLGEGGLRAIRESPLRGVSA